MLLKEIDFSLALFRLAKRHSGGLWTLVHNWTKVVSMLSKDWGRILGQLIRPHLEKAWHFQYLFIYVKTNPYRAVMKDHQLTIWFTTMIFCCSVCFRKIFFKIDLKIGFYWLECGILVWYLKNNKICKSFTYSLYKVKLQCFGLNFSLLNIHRLLVYPCSEALFRATHFGAVFLNVNETFHAPPHFALQTFPLHSVRPFL